MKKLFQALSCITLALLLIVGGCLTYVFIAYHLLDDSLALDVVSATDNEAACGTPYRIVSWNDGFGTYEDDYGFFMDGGTQSWPSRSRRTPSTASTSRSLPRWMRMTPCPPAATRTGRITRGSTC